MGANDEGVEKHPSYKLQNACVSLLHYCMLCALCMMCFLFFIFFFCCSVVLCVLCVCVCSSRHSFITCRLLQHIFNGCMSCMRIAGLRRSANAKRNNVTDKHYQELPIGIYNDDWVRKYVHATDHCLVRSSSINNMYPKRENIKKRMVQNVGSPTPGMNSHSLTASVANSFLF